MGEVLFLELFVFEVGLIEALNGASEGRNSAPGMPRLERFRVVLSFWGDLGW